MSTTAVQASDIGHLTGRQEDWETDNEIRIAVEVKDNPGIIAMRLFIRYDPKLIQLVSVENGSIFQAADVEHGRVLTDMPYILTWEDALSSTDNSKTGDLVYLLFTVQRDALFRETDILLQLDTGSTFNTDLQDVVFSVDTIHCILPVKESPKVANCKHENAKWQSIQGATCRLTGLEQDICPECGKVLDSRATTTTGHHFDEWRLESPATAERNGTQFRVCAVCGFTETKIFSSNTYISPKPSSFDRQGNSWSEEGDSSISTATDSCPSDSIAAKHRASRILLIIISMIVVLVCFMAGALIYRKVRKKEKIK